MKRKTFIPIALTALVVAAIFCMPYWQAQAATPVSGALGAKAGSGGVTTKTFVKLSAAGTVVTATAVSDPVVGVCELTASANALTKYAPVGTQTTVTSGEAITVGSLVTAGTSGKAYVLDTDDASDQRIAAMALTAATDADQDVTVIVCPSAVEQRLALASAAIGGGYGSTGVSISAAGVIQANGAVTTDGALTADNIVCTNAATFGGGYGSTGATISTAGVGQFNGAVTTDGALTADNVVCTNAATFGGGYGATGATISTAGVGQFNGAVTTDGALTALSAAIGGGYGATGASISDAGVIQANGAITTDGALTADSAAIGGGYGATGVSISNAGVIQANGAITSDGAITGGSLTDGTITVAAGAVTGALDISGATVTYRAIANADVAADAAIARSKLAEEALVKYPVKFTDLRNSAGLALVAAAEDNEFGITLVGFGTGTLVIDGDPASNESETQTLVFEFTLPPEYVADADVKLVVQARESVGAATVATTISAEVYEDDGQGGVSANLYNAFDVTDITTSWQTCTSVITDTALAAGDKLRVFVRIVTNDTGAAIGTVAQIGEIYLLLDIKG